jgi:hypothetical protein
MWIDECGKVFGELLVSASFELPPLIELSSNLNFKCLRYSASGSSHQLKSSTYTNVHQFRAIGALTSSIAEEGSQRFRPLHEVDALGGEVKVDCLQSLRLLQ